MAKASTKNKLLLKIPVYISEIQEYDTGTLLDLTMEEIIDLLKNRIQKYNENKNYLCQFGKKGKSEAVSIVEILSEDIKFGDSDPALLLRVLTERTNLCGGTIKHSDTENSKTELSYSDKLTVPTNIVVLYPRIAESKTKKNVGEWFVYVFVYEDQSKPNVDMSQLARQMLRNIFQTPIRNIKEDRFRDEIKTAAENIKLDIVLSNFEDAPDFELPDNLTKYSCCVKERKETYISVEDVSADDAESMMNDSTFPSWKQKVFKFFKSDKRKLTAKFTEKVKDAKVTIERAFEDCFNFELEVEEADLINGKLFETEIIKLNIECLLKQI